MLQDMGWTGVHGKCIQANDRAGTWGYQMPSDLVRARRVTGMTQTLSSAQGVR
jgi:hypothetical protein